MKCHALFSLKKKKVSKFHLLQVLCWQKIITRGAWWSYITHLSKQICTLTIEVSAKFTALRVLYTFQVQEWHDGPIKWSSYAIYGKQSLIFFYLIFKFSIDVGKICPPTSPPPPPPPNNHPYEGHVFWHVMMAWTILVEGHQRNSSAKLHWNWSSGLWQEGFKVFCTDI